MDDDEDRFFPDIFQCQYFRVFFPIFFVVMNDLVNEIEAYGFSWKRVKPQKISVYDRKLLAKNK